MLGLSRQFKYLQSCVGLQTFSRPIPTDPAAIRAVMVQMREQTEKLRETCREIRQGSTQLRELFHATRKQIVEIRERHLQLVMESRLSAAQSSVSLSSNLAADLSDAVEQFEGVLGIADNLKTMSRWPITLEQIISQEKACMAVSFPGTALTELALQVDERYHRYLRCLA